MYICLMSYEKTELLTLGDYMSNIAGVLCIYLMSYEKTELLILGDYMSNIAGVLCLYVLCLMRRWNSLPLVTI
jgi:nicotinamide riboside transporter PnuC